MIAIGFTTNGIWKTWHWITVEGIVESRAVCGKMVDSNDIKTGDPTELTCRKCVLAYYE